MDHHINQHYAHPYISHPQTASSKPFIYCSVLFISMEIFTRLGASWCNLCGKGIFRIPPSNFLRPTEKFIYSIINIGIIIALLIQVLVLQA